MREVLSLSVGPSGRAMVEKGLFGQEQRGDDDPLRHSRDKSPRVVIFDARRRRRSRNEEREDVSEDRDSGEWWDGVVESHQIGGEEGLLPFWEGTEGLYGLDGYSSGVRGGCLEDWWWDKAEDCVRRELELCDSVAGVVCASDSGGYAGISVELLRFFEEECKAAQRVSVLCASLQFDESLKARLTAFSNAVSLGEMTKASDALIPAPTANAPLVGAALDLVTSPFRQKTDHGRCDFQEWTSLVTRHGDYKLLDLRIGRDPQHLQSMFAWPAIDDDDDASLVVKEWSRGVVVPADSPSHPVACANLQCAGHKAVGLLRKCAFLLDVRRRHADVVCAATHFHMMLDDVAEIHEDLAGSADAYQFTEP